LSWREAHSFPSRRVRPSASAFPRFQDAWQVFFPWAFAFEAGFDLRQGKRAGAAGEDLGQGAHLLGQWARAGVWRGRQDWSGSAN
jgi:hypothetical protein